MFPPSALKMLLEAGADPTVSSRTVDGRVDRNALDQCIMSGMVEHARLIVEACPQAVSIVSKDGVAPLDRLAESAHLWQEEVVRDLTCLLLEHGANPDSPAVLKAGPKLHKWVSVAQARIQQKSLDAGLPGPGRPKPSSPRF